MTESSEQDPAVREATDDLVADIEDTRTDITETVEAIGDRLDPGRIVQDAKETVREATVGRVETMTQQMTGVASDAGETIQTTAGGVVETIRRNPVPAAMAAIGIGWLLTHRSSTDTTWRTDQSWRAGSTTPGRSSMHDPRSGSWQRGDDWTGGGRDGGPLEDAGRAAGDVVEQARSGGSDVIDALQREPLAAGAAALAAGAAIAMLVPATRVEQDVLGPTGQRMLGSVERAAADRMETMRQEAEPVGSAAGATTSSPAASTAGSGAGDGLEA
jgi:hypothetical protein